MIFIDRTKVAAPDSITSKGCLGELETMRAISHFKVKRSKYVPFKFKAYNSEDVKDALIDLFHGKCAYCESKILVVYYSDIEHFRPKGEIDYWKPKGKMEKIRPGYYRLSSNWNNLLLACKICNSRKKNKLSNGTLEVTGKGNYFPLRNKAKNIRNWNDITREEKNRLLVNPCVENPEALFKYNETDGNIAIKTRDPNKLDMALASIEIYGLHRKILSDARLIHIKNLQFAIVRVKEGIENLDLATTKKLKTRFQRIIHREISYLKNACLSNNEYAAVARQLFKNFKKKK